MTRSAMITRHAERPAGARRTTARGARLTAAVVATLGFAGVAAPAANAADDCPNAAIRAQQGSSYLPQCRAYEMVSPLDTAGTAASGTPYVTADGSTTIYTAVNALDDALASVSGFQRSERTSDGWRTTSIGPAYTTRTPTGSTDLPILGAASPDTSRLIYSGSYPFDPQDAGLFRGLTRSPDVYRREADGTMTWLSPGLTLPDTSAVGTNFLAASTDLSRVLMASNKPLAADVLDASVFHLYLHVDGLPPQLVTRAPDGTPMNADLPGNTTNVEWTKMSHDGSRVVFQAGRDGNPRTLYLRDHADDPARARTIELDPGTDGRHCVYPELKTISGDGRTIEFHCADQLTDVPAPVGSLYRLDLDTDELTWYSPAASEPEVFQTDDALVPEDQNGTTDVYARVDGQPRLISSGTHPKPSFLASVSADQRSIFFTTMESLVPQDTDGDVQSLYVARIDGGFAAPESVAECVRECQGPGLPAPSLPTVASVSFVGPGNVLDPLATAGSALGRLSTAKAKTVVGTSAAVSVKLPAAGRVRVSGSGLRAVSRAVTKAGNVRLSVRLSDRSRTTLARKGRVAVRATVRFTPASGQAQTQTQRVNLTFTRKAKSKQGVSRTGAVRAIANGKDGR